MCEFLILILIEEMQFEEFKNFGKGPSILQHLRKLQKMQHSGMSKMQPCF